VELFFHESCISYLSYVVFNRFRRRSSLRAVSARILRLKNKYHWHTCAYLRDSTICRVYTRYLLISNGNVIRSINTFICFPLQKSKLMLTNLILILFILNIKNKSAFNMKNKYLVTTYRISVRGDYLRKIEYLIRFY